MNKRKKKFLKKLFEYILIIGVLFLCANVLMTFIFSSEKIEGQSMEPNFTDNERVLSLRITPIRRGDVVIFKAPDQDDHYYVKRVIGLPGDNIEVKHDRLYINGKLEKENYLKDFLDEKAHRQGKQSDLTKSFTLKKLLNVDEVPANEYFVLGDNRGISLDSRSYGFIKRSSIIGVVFLRYWPIGHLKIF